MSVREWHHHWAELEEEARRRKEEEQRLEREPLAKLEKERVELLLREAENWRRAADLGAFAARVARGRCCAFGIAEERPLAYETHKTRDIAEAGQRLAH